MGNHRYNHSISWKPRDLTLEAKGVIENQPENSFAQAAKGRVLKSVIWTLSTEGATLQREREGLPAQRMAPAGLDPESPGRDRCASKVLTGAAASPAARPEPLFLRFQICFCFSFFFVQKRRVGTDCVLSLISVFEMSDCPGSPRTYLTRKDSQRAPRFPCPPLGTLGPLAPPSSSPQGASLLTLLSASPPSRFYGPVLCPAPHAWPLAESPVLPGEAPLRLIQVN